LDFPSRLDLYAVGRDYVRQRAKKIDPSQVDVLGSDVNLFVGSNSVVADAVLKQLIYSSARLFLDGASDDDLDRLAYDRYGLTRKGASAALGGVVMSRLSAALGAGSVPIGTKLTSLGGSEYITLSTAVFGATDLTATAPVNVRAVQAGKATQANAGTITKFATPSSLFDSTLTVTNPASTAGGEDAESDPTFRSRIRSFWTTARRGTLIAIQFGALTVPGVVSAQAIETLTGAGLPARLVNLYIADSSGVASTQLAQLVTSALDDYRAAGIAVIVNNSLPLIVNVQLQLTFAAGVDTVTLGNQICAALVEFINSLPVNGTLLTSDLYTVLKRFAEDGLIVTDGTIVLPTGDLVPSVNQTIRATLATVTVLPTS
jgi:uncharacterized phage protein gp47/JayE